MVSEAVIVVVGFAEALSAPEVVWSLVDAGFTVLAFARRGRRAALRHSRHVTVHEIAAPETDTQAAKSDLLALLDMTSSTGRRVLLLPLDDTALWLSDQVKAKGVTLVGPLGPQAQVALDKERQIRYAVEAGFDVPQSFVHSATSPVDPTTLKLPVIVRPARAVIEVGGRIGKGKNWICSNLGEVIPALRTSPDSSPMLIQPYISGIGEGVFGLATETGVVAWSAHRRLRMMNPHGSGSSACVSQPVPAELRQIVEEFVRLTAWRGLFMVELLRDASGKLWFVEFNGRPWGSMALSRRQGMEYPAWAVMCALNRTIPDSLEPRSSGAVTCRNVGRECMHLLFVLKGPRSKAIKSWPSFWKTAAQLMAIHRDDTFYNWRRDDAKVFISDCWYTILGNLTKSRN